MIKDIYDAVHAFHAHELLVDLPEKLLCCLGIGRGAGSRCSKLARRRDAG